MEIYQNPSQKLSKNVVICFLILIGFSVMLGFIFYILNFEAVIIFSAIKLLIFFLVFTKLADYFHIYGIKLATIMGFAAGLIAYLLPHLIAYISILSEGYLITPITYAVAVLGTEGTLIGPGSGGGQSTSITINFIYSLIKIAIIIGGSTLVARIISSKPYSVKNKKFFEKYFETPYVVYKKDGLNLIKDPNALYEYITKIFLNDPARFAKSSAIKNKFILYELPGEPIKIIEINRKHYKLTKTEHSKIKKLIDKTFLT